MKSPKSSSTSGTIRSHRGGTQQISTRSNEPSRKHVARVLSVVLQQLDQRASGFLIISTFKAHARERRRSKRFREIKEPGRPRERNRRAGSIFKAAGLEHGQTEGAEKPTRRRISATNERRTVCLALVGIPVQVETGKKRKQRRSGGHVAGIKFLLLFRPRSPRLPVGRFLSGCRDLNLTADKFSFPARQPASTLSPFRAAVARLSRLMRRCANADLPL